MGSITGRFDGNELQYIKDAIESGLHNKWNKILEEKFSEKIGVKYSIGVNSGTSALHCALYAAGVGKGDEVIVPPLTFGAPAVAALLLGAVPIFADIDKESFTIDPIDIEKKISPKTKAIIPVSVYGLPCDIDRIMEIANKHNIIVIEDNAECLLGKYNGRVAGSVSHMSIFSFQRSKHLTSETGGMIVTNAEILAEKARKYSILGYKSLRAKSGVSVVTMEDVQQPQYDRHEFPAPNYRLAELCAAMIAAQLERIDSFVKKRQEIANIYLLSINKFKWLLPQKTPLNYENSYWTLTVRLDVDAINVTYKEFRKKFIELGGDPFYAAWKLNYLEPAFQNHPLNTTEQKFRKGICPIAERIQPNLIQLKTNYIDLNDARTQANILEKTASYFDAQKILK